MEHCEDPKRITAKQQQGVVPSSHLFLYSLPAHLVTSFFSLSPHVHLSLVGSISVHAYHPHCTVSPWVPAAASRPPGCILTWRSEHSTPSTIKTLQCSPPLTPSLLTISRAWKVIPDSCLLLWPHLLQFSIFHKIWMLKMHLTFLPPYILLPPCTPIPNLSHIIFV